MLDERQQRRPPYPITWSEQAELMKHLPAHLQRMVLFALNCGARDDNVCRLQWAWERKVPELERSVFVIPAAEFKGQRPHVLILNDVATRIVEECRGDHDEFVFVWRRERVKNIEDEPVMPYRPVHTMNNTAFQNARRAAKLERARVHDLRHTFGQRLREAGVTEEDRALLLGHALDRHAAALRHGHDRAAGGGGQQGARDARPNHAAAGGQRMRSGKVAQKVAQKEKRARRRSI